MLSKKQLLVTAITMITGSFFMNLLWLFNKWHRQIDTGTPLKVILIYILVVSVGIAAMVRLSQRAENNSSLTFYICMATLNLCISITGAVFMYSGNGNRITAQFIPLLIPFIIGVLIFEIILLGIKNQKNIT